MALQEMIKGFSDWLNEKGLWDNIRAKRARGEKPARKGSKAYKRAVKAAKEIRENAHYRTLGLGEPVVLKPGITYEIENFYDDSPKNAAEYISRTVKLKEGEIYSSADEFIVSGITLSGNVIYLEQEGEFDMYGGPYTPQMKKPIIEVNGQDVWPMVKSAIDENSGEPDSVFHDISSSLDFFGHLLDKSKTFINAKSIGLI
jgi:hypothetical protein